MNFIHALKNFCSKELMMCSWSDCVEIVILAVIVYQFMRWLMQDTQKNLIGWFYGYSFLVIGSFYCGFSTLHTLLFMTSPVALMCFILVHQQTLQKNFITLTSLSAQPQATTHWLEELIQGCLHALNKNKEVFCIIERTDSLNQFLKTDCVFNADITQEGLEKFFETVNEGSVTLWVTHAGKLHSLNPVWSATVDEVWVNQDVKALHPWKQNALLMTEKSNAIMFSISPTTRLCTLIIEGKVITDLSAHHTFALLKNYCSFSKKTGDAHAQPLNPNSYFKQNYSEK